MTNYNIGKVQDDLFNKQIKSHKTLVLSIMLIGIFFLTVSSTLLFVEIYPYIVDPELIESYEVSTTTVITILFLLMGVLCNKAKSIAGFLVPNEIIVDNGNSKQLYSAGNSLSKSYGDLLDFAQENEWILIDKPESIYQAQGGPCVLSVCHSDHPLAINQKKNNKDIIIHYERPSKADIESQFSNEMVQWKVNLKHKMLSIFPVFFLLGFTFQYLIFFEALKLPMNSLIMYFGIVISSFIVSFVSLDLHKPPTIKKVEAFMNLKALMKDSNMR